MKKDSKMKKYISMLIFLVSSGICNAETKIIEIFPGMKVKMETTPGTNAGISKTIIETWNPHQKKGMSDSEKRKYSAGAVAAVAMAFNTSGRVNELIMAEGMNTACFYNEWSNVESGTGEFDFYAFDKKAHFFQRIDTTPGQGKCITHFPYITETPKISGVYHSTNTTKAHMLGDSDFQSSNGTIKVK
jgi:hypothetical protein